MGILDWFRKEEQNITPVRVKVTRPVRRNYTEDSVSNKALTKGLYFGEYSGLKLASALAAAPVKVPVYFMGFPIPVLEEESDEVQEVLSEIVERWSLKMQQLHIMKRRDGTVWVWPRFDMKKGHVVIETIPDNTVVDIVKDPNTDEVMRIYTDEDLCFSTGYNKTGTVNRKRVFTKTSVQVMYRVKNGVMPVELRDRSFRNTTGILPVPFSQEPDADEIRGHSIYGRIISDLADYHEIDKTRTEKLAKFGEKLTAGIDDIDEFAANNGFDGADDFFENFSLYDSDIILYRKDKEERPEILELSASIASIYGEALKQKFRKIIEGTGVPEIAWGLKTEGNMASVEENMATLMMYVKGDQRELTNPWEIVFKAALRLELQARLMRDDFSLKVTWNDLDSMSDKTKSEVFKNLADGLSKIMSTAGMTKQQLHKFWLMNFPKGTEEDFETFIDGLRDMAAFKGYANAPYMEQLEAGG